MELALYANHEQALTATDARQPPLRLITLDELPAINTFRPWIYG